MIGVTVEKFPLTASKLPCTSSQRFSIWLELEINSKILRDKAMNNERFKKELIKQFDSAKSQGKPHVDINSGWLHRQVGGYPGTVCLYVAKWCIRRRNMEMKFWNHRQRAKVQAWQFVISYQDNRAWSRRKPSMELPFMKKYKISFLITIMLGWPRMKSPIWSISAADTRKKNGSSVTDFQIHGRTRNYPDLFERNGNQVRCVWFRPLLICVLSGMA